MDFYDFDEEELARKVLRFLAKEMGENEVTFARIEAVSEEMMKLAKITSLKVK